MTNTQRPDEQYEIAYDNAIAAADERVEEIRTFVRDGRLASFSFEVIPRGGIRYVEDVTSLVGDLLDNLDAALARAERAEADAARLREALAALAESAWTMQREFPADSYGADMLSTQVQEDVKRARAALATDEGAANV